MTSRSEYRLLLRQDNADERLMPIGREIGLIGDDDWQAYLDRQQKKHDEIARAEKTVFPPSDKLNEILEQNGTATVSTGVRLAELLRRPQLSYEKLKEIDTDRPELPVAILETVQTELKYEGYIRRQSAAVNEAKRLEKKVIPDDINYLEISGLRLEAREKLNKIRPLNIGQASRISGVSPADISVLLIYLAK
ncbi:MAG: hypothetical protein U0L48_07160 [Acutalibacteraceae bacterium]|nr:hypothetical protein [Acutalibacteraceae bacterium]